MSRIEERVRSLSDASDHERGVKRSRRSRGDSLSEHLNKKTKAERMEIIRTPWKLPVSALHLGAVLIQSMFRGHVARNMARFNKMKRVKARVDVASLTAKFLRLTGSHSHGATDRAGFINWCAARIQSWWRMLSCVKRYKYRRFPMFHIAAIQIQSTWRRHRQLKLNRINKPRIQYLSAQSIQRAWRRRANRRVFRYYRDLINFRNEGDPRDMLKSINPAETALFDAASGIHVRFRMGGSSFPPTVYYKVFTHQPVCDVGAFAPRDYTAGSALPLHTIDLHNHSSTKASAIAMSTRQTSIRVGASTFHATLSRSSAAEAKSGYASSGWYQRYEGNGWRSVTVQVLENLGEDPVAKRTKKQTVRFHYSQTTRRADKEARLKERKRKWMARLYKEGMIREGKADSETTGAGREEVDFEGDDWEVEAAGMLEWTTGLDYDRYLEDWVTLGTTSSSKLPVATRRALGAGKK